MNAWTSTVQAAEILQIHPETLRKMNREGWFKFGTHVRTRSSPLAVIKPRLEFNPDAIQELFSTERHKWKNHAKK
jgi:hypothetical protein